MRPKAEAPPTLHIRQTTRMLLPCSCHMGGSGEASSSCSVVVSETTRLQSERVTTSCSSTSRQWRRVIPMQPARLLMLVHQRCEAAGDDASAGPRVHNEGCRKRRALAVARSGVTASFAQSTRPQTCVVNVPRRFDDATA